MNADFLENVTEADWETMAAHSGIDPAGLRNKIEAAVKAYQPPPGPVPVELKLLNEVDVSGADSKPFEFEIGIHEFISLKGRILVHFRSIEDFNVEMKMGLFFFGIEVFSREFKWNQDVGADYWELDQPLLYAVRVEYGARALREAKLFCFFIKGWFSIFGQPRDPFDHNLLCWPLP